MAAYGALISVMQIMDQIQRHPHPPISLHKEHLESLTTNLTFLQEFLEGYNPHRSYTSEADPLESRVAEAAYAAEDVIESYIVDQIHARITDNDGGKISSAEFYQGMEKVIQEMDLIKMEIIEKKKKKKMEGVQIIKKKSSFRSSSTSAQEVSTMVGLDDVLYEMLDKITGGGVDRQIIPIVGMGGLGKTTLARNIYANPLVKEHFDICAWSTISQVHNAPKILTEILCQVDKEIEKDLSEGELGERLYKYLIGRRYLIVMDDMWSIEAWDKVRSFFPDNENGSRVVVTTRLSNLASMFNYSNGLDMKFMDEATSWKLFSRTVFGNEFCPLELEDIGKKNVEGCRGLPLSIAVVGRLLSKSEPTRENWQVTEENLTSVVNSEGDGSCLQILYMSYNNLPIHLKPCFLCMGVFYEDEEIPIQWLIPLMIAEGFIKPIDGKSLEEAAEEYLEELVDRSLVLVGKRNRYGKLKYCKVHDLLMDLCLREGEKEKFLCDMKMSQGMTRSPRRITNWSKEEHSSSTVPLESVEAAIAPSLVRSLRGKFPEETLSLPSFRLLRVCFVEEYGSDEYYEKILIRLLNLRFLAAEQHPLLKIPCYLWNLQTLILVNVEKHWVLEIWKMPLLRHVITIDSPTLCLPDPPPDDEVVVLENLHTLDVVRNLKLSEEVLKRIPNIRYLYLYYNVEDEEEDIRYYDFYYNEEEEEEEEEEEKKGDYYCLNNLHRLNKLQHLGLSIWYGGDPPPVQELSLPYSLKQLTLKGTKLPWEEMASKIGCLPLLQVLILKDDAFIGWEWETVEGQFSSLKYLMIDYCNDLEQWITEDSSHFPRLEHLVLRFLKLLREIPSSIGDIPTLRSIELEDCSDSAEESAQRIQEEQEEYGNEVLPIQVKRGPIFK